MKNLADLLQKGHKEEDVPSHLRIAADLCEENGFNVAAEALRTLASLCTVPREERIKLDTGQGIVTVARRPGEIALILDTPEQVQSALLQGYTVTGTCGRCQRTIQIVRDGYCADCLSVVPQVMFPTDSGWKR